MASLMRLFRKEERTARPLYEAVVARARLPHWYVAGEVPDTLDGRFSVLATLLALADLRLERGGEEARFASVSLAECYVEDMEAQHRQLGTSDMRIGKAVGGLVGALGGKVGAWRRAVDGEESWAAVTARSIYRDQAPNSDAADYVERALREFWAGLQETGDEALVRGRLP